MKTISRRRELLIEANHECFYCGCPVQDDTKYQDNSACLNLYVPKKYGGRPSGDNLKVACYSCCAMIKKDMDTRRDKITVAQVRHVMNSDRKLRGMRYCPDYIDPNVFTIEQVHEPKQLAIEPKPDHPDYGRVTTPNDLGGLKPNEVTIEEDSDNEHERMCRLYEQQHQPPAQSGGPNLANSGNA